MVHLIDKDAVVAEIGKLKENPPCYITMAEKGAYIEGVDDAENVINTLEVVEVDNVWHDANETPKGASDKEILVQFSDFHTSVVEIDDWKYLDHQTKWAYLKDLI